MLFAAKASLMCSACIYIPCRVCEAQQICAGVSFWRWSRFNRNVISVQSLIPAINISKESILIFHVNIHVNKILELCQGVGDRVTEIGNSIHLNITWKCVWRTAFSWVPRNHIQTSTNYLHKWEIKSSVVSCLSATFFIGWKSGAHIKAVTFILMGLMLILVCA